MGLGRVAPGYKNAQPIIHPKHLRPIAMAFMRIQVVSSILGCCCCCNLQVEKAYRREEVHVI